MQASRFFTFLYIVSMGTVAKAQYNNDSTLQNATLQSCVAYAIAHQPRVQQSLLDERITEYEIKSRLADWYPQLGLTANYQHYFELPRTVLGADSTGKRQVIQTGITNTSTVGLGLTQNIFNRDVLLATRTAGDVRTQAKQNTSANKIDLAVAVSKAFYDVLATQQQIALLGEDITRLSRSLQDAYNQYQGGIVDKIDYKRATIALNNSKAQKRTYEEQLVSNLAYLKQLMGFPQQSDIQLQYDSLQMERDVILDTVATLKFEDRIEYKRLQTLQSLTRTNLKYNKWSYLPTVSAFGNYNLAFLNQSFSKLYGSSYNNSYAGVSVSFPIFQGFKRIQQIRSAELQLERVDWNFTSLKDSIITENTQAVASYKANLNNYNILKENLEIAREVYGTIQLQYKAGIKTYLDVIIAENDLRTSQVNYTNALYDVLSSKVDVQRARGEIQY